MWSSTDSSSGSGAPAPADGTSSTEPTASSARTASLTSSQAYAQQLRLDAYHTHCVRCLFGRTAAQLGCIRNDYETPDALRCGGRALRPPQTAAATNDATASGTDDDVEAGGFPSVPPLLAVKFDAGVYRQDGMYVLATGEPYATGVERMRFDRLFCDRRYIEQTLWATRRLLCARSDGAGGGGDYGQLGRLVRRLVELKEEEEGFLLESVRAQLMFARLKVHRANLERSAALEARNMPLPTCDEAVMRNELSVRFTRNWEVARQAQMASQCRMEEERWKREYLDTQKLMDQETRCKVEMDNYLTMKTEQMGQECVAWMEKFDADYEQAEVDIQIASDQLAEMIKVRQEQLDLTEWQKNKLAANLKAQADKAEHKRLFALFTKFGLVIQIWMREFLVRYQLGPYKMKKPKKKKKKK